MLANEALDVSTAASGAEALQRIGQIRPDLLIADLCLASTDGWALLACEKRLRPNLPIFVITALSARETGGAHEVATEYFQKPPDLDALIEAIRRRLRESGSAQPSSAA